VRLKKIRQALFHLAQHVNTSPWPALAATAVLTVALCWPNVIYMDGIPMAVQPD
jgi:hypothetical protein